MNDREKVIKGLECCLKDDCDNCPYYDPEVDHDCDYFGKCLRGNMYRDALALLKAQEPIRPNEIRHGNVFMYYQCPACTSALRVVDRYCSQCGRAVKWE